MGVEPQQSIPVSSQVSTLKPDKFEPTIVKETPDYLYAEYQSPTFGFIDDVEFFFTGNLSCPDYWFCEDRI